MLLTVRMQEEKGKIPMKKWIRQGLSLCAALAMILMQCTVLLPVKAEETVRTPAEIESELIRYYRDHQEAAATDIQRLVEELAAQDEALASTWHDIMQFWSSANQDGFVNTEVLPDGLPEDNSMCIVVLGFALNSDGTMKQELIDRLTVGLRSAEKYPNAYVAVTGGGTASKNPNVTEGGLMGEWMLENGLSEDRLIIENKAPNTVGNAHNTFDILKESYPTVTSLALVTSDYHVPRGCLLFYSTCMTQAYATGQEPLSMVSNAGCVTGSKGYESISLQASGLASVAGVSLGSQKTVLSVLSSLHVEKTAAVSQEEPGLQITAGYDSLYEKDVTDLCTITGFDTAAGQNQTVHIAYEENGVALECDFDLNQDELTVFDTSLLEALIAECEAMNLTVYTAESAGWLQSELARIQALLQNPDLDAVQAAQALADLQSAKNALRLLGNVAAGKQVTANCNQADAQKITDGTIQTSNYWASVENGANVDASEASFVVDLGTLVDLSMIRVYPYYSGNRVYKYTLETSADQETWQSFGENLSDDPVTSAGVSHYNQTQARYIRLQGVETHVPGRDDINNIHIIELQAYGREVNNLAAYKPVTSSGTDTSAASSASSSHQKINDSDISTYWDGGKYAERPWVTVDLEDIYSLSSINVVNYYSRNDRYYNYEVYGSLDGESWSLLHEITGERDKSTAAGDVFEEEGLHARYLKVVGTYNSANSSFHLNELRASGEKDEAWNAARTSLQALADKAAAMESPSAAVTALLEETQTALVNPRLLAEELQALSSRLQNALPKVNKTLLAQSVAYAESLLEQNALEGVNSLVVSFFQEKLEEARTVLADEQADQDAVNAAWRNLSQAIHMVGFTSDFTALDALIAQAQGLDLSQYDEGTEELQAALEFALAVRSNPAALTEQSIAQAVSRLQAALDGLQAIEWDTTLLAFLVQSALECEADRYTEATWAPFAEELSAAQAVLAAPESQEQIDAAVRSLNAAYLNLRLKADESLLASLQSFMQETEPMLVMSLSAQSSQALFALRNEIAPVLEAAEKGNTPEIAALQDLSDVADALLGQLKEEIRGSENKAETPVTPAEKPADKETLQKPAQAASVDASVTKPSGTAASVKTGVAFVPWFLLAGASALSLTAAGRRNRKQK